MGYQERHTDAPNTSRLPEMFRLDKSPGGEVAELRNNSFDNVLFCVLRSRGSVPVKPFTISLRTHFLRVQ